MRVQDPVQDLVLSRAVDDLKGFTAGMFHLDLDLAAPGERACRCGAPVEADLADACAAFADGLRDNPRDRSRCPGGLTVASRVVETPPGRRLLLASEGFLLAGEPDHGRRGKPAPRLTPAEAQLLDGCLSLGASLLGTIGRTLGSALEETGREGSWLALGGSPGLVGVSGGIRALREALPTVANSPEPLFLEGEPGTGRSLFALAVHRFGPRRGGPFVREAVAALPEALHERELFGNGNGGRGLLAEAAGGTLYIAGVDRLAPGAQRRLLALLDAGRGAPPTPDVRLIASASGPRGRGRGLLTALAERLSAFRLVLPALRERPEDIPLLVEHLLARRAAALGTAPVAVAPEALEALKRHPWAANVRELDEELARAAAGRTLVRLEDLAPGIARGGRGGGAASADLRHAVGELERDLIEAALAETGWNKSRAAAQLGLSRLGLQKKIDRYRIDRRRLGAAPARRGPEP